MVDAQVIVPAVAVVAPLAAVGVGVLGVAVHRHPGRWTGWQLLTRVAALGHALGVLWVTFLPLQIATGAYRNQAAWYSSVTPVPLVTIDPATFLLNIVMMVPFGVLLPLLRPGVASVRAVAGRAALVSLGIETLQLLVNLLTSNGRDTDVNDLLANTLGGVVGLLALRLAWRVPAVRGWLAAAGGRNGGVRRAG